MPAIKSLEIQHTGDQNIELLQHNVKKFAKPIEDNPFLAGNLVENIQFSGIVSVTVNHKLGRLPRGWILTDKAGAGNIFRGTPWTKDTITLGNSLAVPCTISIWVF